jgi:amidase
MLSDKTTAEELVQIKAKVRKAGVQFFETPMVKYQLDAILSINNNNSGMLRQTPLPYDPYGLQSNRRTLGTYLYSQTLSRRCPLKNGFCL